MGKGRGGGWGTWRSGDELTGQWEYVGGGVTFSQLSRPVRVYMEALKKFALIPYYLFCCLYGAGLFEEKKVKQSIT